MRTHQAATGGSLLVLAPLGMEARALAATLGRERVVRTGMGAARAERSSGLALSLPGDAVAVVGFCGGLDPDLRAGDLVVATEVRGPDGTVSCPSAALLASELGRSGIRVRSGPIVSTDHVVARQERKRLAEAGAVAVDMESAWLAAGAGGRPLAVVRAVVDRPGRELGRPVATTLGGLKAYRSLRRAGPTLERWAAAVAPRLVLLAGPRSFCAGVERAIEIVERALDRYGAPVYVRKQIVHNVHVVRDLERRGAVFVENVEEVPAGSIVVFSAHGVSPEVREQAGSRRLHVIDATCPLVTKVHTEARRFAQNGYTIFLIGHEGHEEVEGTTGEAPEVIRLIGEDAAESEMKGVDVADSRKVAYLTQTTLAVDEVDEVVQRLRDRFPDLAGPGSADICYATQNRQDAVKALARECDVLLVIGSENSSNSRRLVEVAEREGCRARLVDDETGLDLEWLRDARVVGLTAGASAPEVLVERVLGALSGLGPVEVEHREVVSESVRFTLPVELRRPDETRFTADPANMDQANRVNPRPSGR
jgi:4-hydroxy-3-methylbut-2-en-1-yl diphosphate reductase